MKGINNSDVLKKQTSMTMFLFVLICMVTPLELVHAAVSSDATADTAAGAREILQRWESNWNGTVPRGKTRNSTRILLLSNKMYPGRFDLSNLKFPKRVTVRGSGPFNADGSSGTRIRNVVDLSNSSNINLTLMKVYGGTNRVVADNASNITLNRIWLEGKIVSPKSEEPISLYGVELKKVKNFLIQNSNFSHFQQSAIFVRDSSDVSIEGTTYEHLGHDSIKTHGRDVKNINVFRNWSCRNLNTATRWRIINGQKVSQGGEHTDFFQAQPDGYLENGYLWGNVMMKGESSRYNGASWMAIFLSGNLTATNFKARQNIIIGQNRGGITYGTGATIRGSDVSYNTLLRVEVGAVGSNQTASYPYVYGEDMSKSYNLVATPTDVSSADYGLGSGGKRVVVGVLPRIKFNEIQKIFAGYPRERGDFSVMRPKTGTISHWNSKNKIGAVNRLKEIFVDGRHPGNVGWPVARPWTAQYNKPRGIKSSYTGKYGENGQNIK